MNRSKQPYIGPTSELPEGPYGIDAASDLRAAPATVLASSVARDQFVNTVRIPRKLLLDAESRTKRRSNRLSAAMCQAVSHQLALDKAQTYTRTFFEEGFGVELEASSVLENSFSLLGTVELLTHRVRQMQVPVSMKRYLLKQIADTFKGELDIAFALARKEKQPTFVKRLGALIEAAESAARGRVRTLSPKASDKKSRK